MFAMDQMSGTLYFQHAHWPLHCFEEKATNI